MRTENRFPPGGGFYSLVTGAEVKLAPGAELAAAHAKLCGAMVPPTSDQAEDWVAMLQAACARRPDSEASAAVAFSLYVGELCQWPADIARTVCMKRARGEGVVGTNWFPPLAEISQECARLTAPRRAMLQAVKFKAPKEIERYPVARKEPTEDEIAAVHRMKEEALKQLDAAAERSKPKRVDLPAIHGKADETGITPQLRSIIERQRGAA